MAHILIAEDERPLNELLRMSFERKGHLVFSAFDGEEALGIFNQEEIDLLLLDVMMPKMDGITLARKVREESDVPIVLLTTLNRPDDIAAGLLNAQADDYIVKPSPFRVVEAKVDAILRRIHWIEEPLQLTQLIIGPYRLDTTTRFFDHRGKSVKLSITECKVLEFLMQRSPDTVPMQTIYEAVWDKYHDGVFSTLHTTLSRVRGKLRKIGVDPNIVETVPNVGYRFNGHPSA